MSDYFIIHRHSSGNKVRNELVNEYLMNKKLQRNKNIGYSYKYHKQKKLVNAKILQVNTYINHFAVIK